MPGAGILKLRENRISDQCVRLQLSDLKLESLSHLEDQVRKTFPWLGDLTLTYSACIGKQVQPLANDSDLVSVLSLSCNMLAIDVDLEDNNFDQSALEERLIQTWQIVDKEQEPRCKKLSIAMNPREIIQRFSDSLYNSASVFIKEATQNGIDAFRVAHFDLQHCAQCIQSSASLDSINAKIVVDIESELKIVVTDFGCGMTEEYIQKHFWAIAQSSKKGDYGRIRKLIGRFGIGGLACLQICKQEQLLTKNIYDGKTWDSTMDMTSDDLTYSLKIADQPLFHYGTKLVLHLKEDQRLSEQTVCRFLEEAQGAFKYAGVCFEVRDSVYGHSIVNEPVKMCFAFADGDMLVQECNVTFPVRAAGRQANVSTQFDVSRGKEQQWRVLIKSVLLKQQIQDGQEEEDEDKHGCGLLAISSVTAVDVISCGTRLLLHKEACTPNGFCFAGEVSLDHLQPYVDRSRLREFDDYLVKSLLNKVQKETFLAMKRTCLAEDSFNSVPNFGQYFCLLKAFDQADHYLGLSPLLVEVFQAGMVRSCKLWQLVEKNLLCCLHLWRPFHNSLANEERALVRLDKITTSMRPLVQDFLLHKSASLEYVDHLKFDEVFDKDSLIEKVGAEHVQSWSNVFDILSEIIHRDDLQLPPSKSKLLFCRICDDTTPMLVIPEADKSLCFYINIASSKVLQACADPVPRTLLRQTLLADFFKPFIHLWLHLQPVFRFPLTLGALPADYDSIIPYGFSGDCRYWKGPEGQLIHVFKWPSHPDWVGYYMRMHAAYNAPANSWRAAFQQIAPEISFKVSSTILVAQCDWMGQQGEIEYSIEVLNPAQFAKPHCRFYPEFSRSLPVMCYDTGVFVPIPSEAFDLFNPQGCQTYINIGAKFIKYNQGKCFLRNTGFTSMDDNILLVQNLKVGSIVKVRDQKQVCVKSITVYPPKKRFPYKVTQLVTHQGTFKVSAGHRITVPGVSGTGYESKPAEEMQVGDLVFVRGKTCPLTKVTTIKERTELYMVAFEADISVESFMVPEIGIETYGEPSETPDASTSQEVQVTQSGLALLSLFANITVSDLQQAMPDAYEG